MAVMPRRAKISKLVFSRFRCPYTSRYEIIEKMFTGWCPACMCKFMLLFMLSTLGSDREKLVNILVKLTVFISCLFVSTLILVMLFHKILIP